MSTSETKDSRALHGVTDVAKGTSSKANDGETALSTGVNGVGKIIISYITIGSALVKLGSTIHDGYDSSKMYVNKTAMSGTVYALEGCYAPICTSA